MELSDKLSIGAIIISVISLFLSGYIGYRFAIKSYKVQEKLGQLKSIKRLLKSLMDNVESLNAVGIQIAIEEYNMTIDNLTKFDSEPTAEEYWKKVYEKHNFQELFELVLKLSIENFDIILKELSPKAYQNFDILKKLNNNDQLNGQRKALIVFQTFFQNQLLSDLQKLEDKELSENLK